MNNILEVKTDLGTLVAKAFRQGKNSPGISISLTLPGQENPTTIAYVECSGRNAMPERNRGQILAHVWKTPDQSDRILINSAGAELKEFSVVTPDELVNMMATLTSGYDGRLIIQGDPDGGEAYGVVATEAFDAKIYTITYLGGTFGSSVTIPADATETEEKDMLMDMLTNLWANSGLDSYYIARKDWPVIPNL